MAITRRVMSQMEAFKMGQLMSANIRSVPVPDGAEPVCEYINGYDDASIAAEISLDLRAMHASTLRKNLFGVLNVKTPAPEANECSKLAVTYDRRIAELEQSLATLMQEHNQLVGNHNKLCAAVARRSGNLVVNGEAQQHEVI